MSHARVQPFKKEKEYPFRLTPKQFELLSTIYRIQHFTGCSPSLQELGNRLERTKGATAEMVARLERLGYIERQHNTVRSYRIPNHIRTILRYWL